MYGSLFCRVYNEFGWNVYPEVFAERLWRYLEQNGRPVRSALDLGSGTGVLCQALAAHGIEASGVDLSEAMIAIARERSGALRFIAHDMVTYRDEAQYDLITSTGDALNHIFDPDDLLRIFDNVHAMLSPGGLFVFDLLGEGEIPDDEPFVLDYSDTVRAVFQTTRGGDGGVRLHIEVYENGSLALEENILEKLHPVDGVRAMLARAGLRVLQCSHRLLDEDSADAATWFVVAQKEERA